MKKLAIPLTLLVFLLAGCDLISPSAPEPLPTIVLDSGYSEQDSDSPAPVQIVDGAVVASGVIVSAHEVHLAFAAGGVIQQVDVSVGETVKAGQTLVSLDDSEVQLAVDQAEVAVTAAEFNLVQAQSTAQARQDAQISAAVLALTDAQYALDQFNRNAPLVAAEAQVALSNAQEALKDAQRKRTNMDYPRANQTTIDEARAFYDLKEIELEKAKEAYNRLRNKASDDPQKIRALLNQTNAQRERDKALITLNWYLGENSELDLAQADSELALAQKQLESSQQRWDEVKDGPAPADLALLTAKLDNAQAQLDLARAQSTDAEIALAQTQVETARLNLELAQAQLAKTRITAPFDGFIAALNVEPGAWVTVGQPVVFLVDLGQLMVRTTDLSERDLPQVAADQPVTVIVKALGEQTAGRVSEISPLADSLGGDVVYETMIEMDAPIPGLKMGMSAEVRFKANP